MSIEITGIDLKEFAKKVYALSQPQCLGFLHAVPGPLPNSVVDEILRVQANSTISALDMDYVMGRACKMHVWKDGDKLFIDDSWYDHTDEQFTQLLATFNISEPEKKEHNCSCNCVKCQGGL